MKLTHQRLEIFKELLAAKDHPSAELIYKKLQKRMPTIAMDNSLPNFCNI
jgi:Fur family peroxide stress response transcriptional regulator